ncbi:MAG: alkaline phosphatase [Clostridiales bacterium]|nr:MAG: alkaline phosphatase [Clostridiales bacterium]
MPTDSAAAGSALATGQKFNNGEVARHGGNNVKSIAEYAKEKGLGVGIVTTDKLYGATPASFSSHANNRGDTSEIIKGQINYVVDLYLGAGKDEYTKYKSQFESKGFTFATSFNDVGGSVLSNKLIMPFSSLPSEDGTADTPTLEMCTEFALEFMEARFPDGYF